MTAIAQAGVFAFGPAPVKNIQAHQANDAVIPANLISSVTLLAAAQPLYSTGLKSLPFPARIAITVTKAGATFTGTFTVHGTKRGESVASTEDVIFTDAGVMSTTACFTKITSIDLPMRTTALDAATIGTKQMPLTFRHRAADIDLAAIDDVRLGPNEVGGLPTPSFAYKGGQMAAGGATLYPRLEDSFYWLLRATLGYDGGYHETSSVYDYDQGTVNADAAVGILPSTALLVGAQATFSTGLVQPKDPTLVTVFRSPTGMNGAVTINGTNSLDVVISETLTFSGSTEDFIEGALYFKTITSVDLPAWTNSGDRVSVGYLMWDHAFYYNPGEGLAACIPWMSFYKLIPSGACSPTDNDSLWEIYKNCKMMGMVFTMPNDSPVAARVDVLGTDWQFSDTNPMSYMGSYEDYSSVPIGSVSGGYIKIPTYSNNALPVVSAQVSIANAPLDPRQEKVIGSPALEDITVISRALSLDLIVKWKDPDLYRTIYTGSKTGTVWTEKPFTQSVDVMSVANGHPAECAFNWRLRVQAPVVLFQVNGGVRLAGNQAVMLRLTGTALAPNTGHYCTITLTNRQRYYRWPSA